MLLFGDNPAPVMVAGLSHSVVVGGDISIEIRNDDVRIMMTSRKHAHPSLHPVHTYIYKTTVISEA